MYGKFRCNLKTCYFILVFLVCIVLWIQVKDTLESSGIRELPMKSSEMLIRGFSLVEKQLSFAHVEEMTANVFLEKVPYFTNVEGKTVDVLLNLTQLRLNAFGEKFKFKSISQAEVSYYNMSGLRKNHCNFGFIINGSRVCEGRTPFMIIIIPSAPWKTQQRMVIRETWGRYAKDLQASLPNNSNTLALVFLLGREDNTSADLAHISESEKFSDMVIGDFKDSYPNLTRKILMGLKWVSMYCARAGYILKADDDIFIHIPRLIDMLKENPTKPSGTLYGFLYGGGPVHRRGKWAVSLDEYPMSSYPPYMSGNAYVVSANMARKLVLASEYMPYLPLEDVFITGVMPKILGTQFVSKRREFTSWNEKKIEPCEFMNGKKIAGNRMNINLMKTMWIIQQKYPYSCKNTTVEQGKTKKKLN